MLTTERLILRKWRNEDAAKLYEYASDPDVGPRAGWPPHKSVEESLDVIQNVFNTPECYAVCLKDGEGPIGAIALTETESVYEAELGYWLAKPFWGCGYMTEAGEAIIDHGFDQGLEAIWCCYFEGNDQSRRVQEKLGFVYHHTNQELPVPLLNEKRTEHANLLTRKMWMRRKNGKM